MLSTLEPLILLVHNVSPILHPADKIDGRGPDDDRGAGAIKQPATAHLTLHVQVVVNDVKALLGLEILVNFHLPSHGRCLAGSLQNGLAVEAQGSSAQQGVSRIHNGTGLGPAAS